jgi:hypothetical protein
LGLYTADAFPHTGLVAEFVLNFGTSKTAFDTAQEMTDASSKPPGPHEPDHTFDFEQRHVRGFRDQRLNQITTPRAYCAIRQGCRDTIRWRLSAKRPKTPLFHRLDMSIPR